jgi:hypothetical protein
LPAKPHDKDHPADQDYEDYSKVMIVPVEMLRKQPAFKGYAHHIYRVAVGMTDRHCAEKGIDLHRGALYANLAITYFEKRQFEMGLSWLLAAANEDVRFNRVPTIYDSYALSDGGIFGQWVQQELMPVLDPDVLGFVNGKLATAYGFPAVMQVLRSLAGKGDMNILAGIVNFNDARGRTDYVGHSVRFTCLRDLATLTEVLLKLVGNNHADGAVRAKYKDGPMVGGMIHHMHYYKGAMSEGLFWNSVAKRADLLKAIDVGFDPIKDFKTVDIAAVRTYLNAKALSPDPDVDALAKRYLLAYRLRNETSHSFNPKDQGVIDHAVEFRLWLLQTVFYSYFHFRDSGQVVF